jgi:hypothetical protein
MISFTDLIDCKKRLGPMIRGEIRLRMSDPMIYIGKIERLKTLIKDS